MNATQSRKNDWESNSIVRETVGGRGVYHSNGCAIVGCLNLGLLSGYEKVVYLSEREQDGIFDRSSVEQAVRERDDSPWMTYNYSKADRTTNIQKEVCDFTMNSGSRNYQPLSVAQVDADIKSMVAAHAAPIVKLSYHDIFDTSARKPSLAQSYLPRLKTTPKQTGESANSCTSNHSRTGQGYVYGNGKYQFQGRENLSGSSYLKKYLRFQERVNVVHDDEHVDNVRRIPLGFPCSLESALGQYSDPNIVLKVRKDRT